MRPGEQTAAGDSYGGTGGVVLQVVLTVVAAARLVVSVFAPELQGLTMSLTAILLVGLVALVARGPRRRRSRP